MWNLLHLLQQHRRYFLLHQWNSSIVVYFLLVMTQCQSQFALQQKVLQTIHRCVWVQNTSDFSVLLFMAILFRLFYEVESGLAEIPYKIISLGVLHGLSVVILKTHKIKNCFKQNHPLAWMTACKPPLRTGEVTVLLWHIYKTFIADELQQLRTFDQQNWNPLYYGRQCSLHFRLL